jgi:hypothetical protein
MFHYRDWGELNSFYIEDVEQAHEIEVIYTEHLTLEYTIEGWVSDSALITVRNEDGADFGYWMVKDSVHINQRLSNYYYGTTPILMKYKPIASKKGELLIKMKAVLF